MFDSLSFSNLSFSSVSWSGLEELVNTIRSRRPNISVSGDLNLPSLMNRALKENKELTIQESKLIIEDEELIIMVQLLVINNVL